MPKTKPKAGSKPKAGKTKKVVWTYTTRRLLPDGEPLSMGWGKDPVLEAGDKVQFAGVQFVGITGVRAEGIVVRVEDLGFDRYDAWIELQE